MRPIDEKELRSVLLKRIEKIKDEGIAAGIRIAIYQARQMPTCTLEELGPKGRWISNGDGDFWCTNCGDFALERSERAVESDFCPHCGADMRGGSDG